MIQKNVHYKMRRNRKTYPTKMLIPICKADFWLISLKQITSRILKFRYGLP